MAATLLTGGRIIDPATGTDIVGDLLLENGVVSKIGKKLKVPKAKTIEVKGHVVCPGLFDMHVHLREPGREDKETLETGLSAALAGGVTSVLSMPNTAPLADNQTVVEFQLSRARKLDLARLYVSGRITKEGRKLAEMWELKTAGAVAVTDDSGDVNDECLLLHALEWAKTFDLPLINHADMESLSHGGVMHEGKVSALLGVPGIPHSSEVMAVHRSIILAEETDARLHITHISCEGSVDAVRQAKRRGVRVTADVTPHHVGLTCEECIGWRTNAKMHPPLREEADRRACLKGLKDGTIDAIATDHAPHLVSEKLLPFQAAPIGTVGLETFFAAVNTHVVKAGVLSLPEAIAKMTLAPARILGVPGGSLEPGQPADVAVFDPEATWTVDPSTFLSKGRNSAFAGKTLVGKPAYTFVGGVLKADHGRVL